MLDVNGTRYHLVFGPQDWPIDTAGRTWDYNAKRHWVELQAEPYRFAYQGPTQRAGRRRGSARDAYGHWYWISETGQHIMVQWALAHQAIELYPGLVTPSSPPPAALGEFQPLSSPEPAVSPTLSGLAVLDDGYLVAGATEASRSFLLVFDLYALEGGPFSIGLPAAPTPLASVVEAAERFDLAPLPQQGLLVLDRSTHQVWRLDSALRPQPGAPSAPETPMTFQPSTGTERLVERPILGQPIGLDPDTHDPIAITALPDGSFWVLDQRADQQASVLWLYSQPRQFQAYRCQLETRYLMEQQADALDLQALRGIDLAYLPAATDPLPQSPLGQLFVVDQSGSQVYALAVTALPDSPRSQAGSEQGLSLRLQRQDYYPLRYFAGAALVEDWDADQVYYLQRYQGTRWLALQGFAHQRYERNAEITLPVGEDTQAFDGQVPGCVWHRLCLDAHIPPGTGLALAARTTDELPHWGAWQPQPTPYLRPVGSEVPYTHLWTPDELDQPHTGTWELLFQGMQGRFLQLRLTLTGNGLASPRVRAMRLHYPRFSYLKEYLPAVYQQEPESMQFLENFLANPEGLFTTMEGMIAQMQGLMDVRTVPEDALDWLAGWLGLLLQPAWSEYQRRLLIAHAPYFFQRRGTLLGVLQAVLLTVYPKLGPEIFQDAIVQNHTAVRIVEQFLTRTQPGVALGNPTEQAIATVGLPHEDARARAHRFTVMLPTDIAPQTLGLVKQIVELEKPAHTAFALQPYWRFFRVGEVRLGVDTVLGPGGQLEYFKLGQTALAEGLLWDSFPYHLSNRIVIPNQLRTYRRT